MPRGVYDRSKSKLRHKHSEETKRKMSEARKAHYSKMTLEERRKELKNFIAAGMVNAIGRKVSEETRRKLADCQRGRIKSKEEIEKISNSLKGNVPWNKGRAWTEEEKENIRRGVLKSGKYGLETMSSGMPTSIEVKVGQQLEDYGIKYIYQKPICRGHFIVDFYLPEYQLVIECNGSYWHNRPERKLRDKELEEYVLSKGKDILWLWDYEINDEWFDISDYLET